jgi:hypothetical protein
VLSATVSITVERVEAVPVFVAGRSTLTFLFHLTRSDRIAACLLSDDSLDLCLEVADRQSESCALPRVLLLEIDTAAKYEIPRDIDHTIVRPASIHHDNPQRRLLDSHLSFIQLSPAYHE